MYVRFIARMLCDHVVVTLVVSHECKKSMQQELLSISAVDIHTSCLPNPSRLPVNRKLNKLFMLACNFRHRTVYIFIQLLSVLCTMHVVL